MKYDKWTIMLAITPLTIFVLVPLAIFILYCVGFVQNTRPLIPAPQWLVKAGMHTGEPMPVKVYQVKGHEIFFLRVGKARDALPSHLRWFAMDFSGNKRERTWYKFPDDKVYVRIMTPGTFPYLHHQPAGYFGIDILTGKDGAHWLSYTGDSVVFSNYLFFVSATQENSGRPPVEVHRSTMDGWKKE